eukprot:1997458-Prorocentrum_lima.AAC.1
MMPQDTHWDARTTSTTTVTRTDASQTQPTPEHKRPRIQPNTIWQIGHSAQQLHDIQNMHCGPGTPPITAQPTIPTPWSPIQGNTTEP